MAARDDPFRDFPKKRKPPFKVVNGGGQSTGQVQRPVWINGQELADKIFPPIRWVVPGLIPEGLTLLVGRPKVGKSWFASNVTTAVGLGGMALSAIICPEGDVLHLALEDTERRLKERQDMLCSEGFRPRRVSWAVEWPRLDQGAVGFIEQWIASIQNPRWIVIDPIGMLRRSKGKDEQLYDYDYQSVLPLRELANKHKLGICAIHHLNKRSDSDDPFDLISGSNGLAACADTIMIMRRSGQGTTLYGRGRDVSEFDKALTFTANCSWKLLGDSAELAMSEQRANLQEAIANFAAGASISDICEATSYRRSNVKFLLNKMVKDGQAVRIGKGKYGPAPNIPR